MKVVTMSQKKKNVLSTNHSKEPQNQFSPSEKKKKKN